MYPRSIPDQTEKPVVIWRNATIMVRVRAQTGAALRQPMQPRQRPCRSDEGHRATGPKVPLKDFISPERRRS